MAANTGNSFDSSVANPFLNPILFLFELWQWLVGYFLAPNPPRSDAELSRPKVAIIGAGITGVTAAAHCVGHGFDVVIFEAGDEKNLGGIWSKVNSTSSLQIHSLMYRFHPTVQWDRGYPDRQQIIDQVRKLWERYNLQPKTRFNQKITKVSQDAKGRWIINDDENNGTFEGLIAAVGTCGAPQMPKIDGLDKFRGPVYHSSQLTGVEAKGKKMLVVGGGASAVEALEYGAAKGATKTYILSRSDKWIIPRNLFVDILLSLNIFGQETIFSWIPETLLRKFFYRDLEDIAPHDKGIFTDTPMVNSDVMDMMRKGDAEWVRGDIEGFTDHGVIMNRRERGVQPGGPGRKELIEGDMVVLATGFERPSLDFLPKDSFGDKYGPPNWYLQTIPPTHPSVSAINCTYLGAIGTVGNWHIGIHTRILLMFMSDPLTRPSPFWMRRWIDMTKLLKAAAPTGAFDFFTYLELVWWFTFCVTINPFRWKWAAFVFFGVGAALPKKVIHAEAPIRDSLGLRHEVGRDKGVSF